MALPAYDPVTGANSVTVPARQLPSEATVLRWVAQGLDGSPDSRFLVVGLLSQKRLDGLWNDKFRALIRAALIGQTEDDLSFEDTVRRAIDCRNLSFDDGAQAINYLTSHDVEGYRKERLFNLLALLEIVWCGFTSS